MFAFASTTQPLLEDVERPNSEEQSNGKARMNNDEHVNQCHGQTLLGCVTSQVYRYVASGTRQSEEDGEE